MVLYVHFNDYASTMLLKKLFHFYRSTKQGKKKKEKKVVNV